MPMPKTHELGIVKKVFFFNIRGADLGFRYETKKREMLNLSDEPRAGMTAVLLPGNPLSVLQQIITINELQQQEHMR